MSTSTVRPLWPYRCLLLLFSPLLLGYTFWQALRHRCGRYLLQRCGLFGRQTLVAPLWLHAASVGELHAALPLLKRLQAEYPQQDVLLTTNTISSARRVESMALQGVRHVFLPLDFPFAVQQFLHCFRPHCALVMETELWPALFAGCARHRLPVLIINGRLSRRTRKAPRWLQAQYRQTLGLATAVLARSEADRESFAALGAVQKRLQVIGNIKFSSMQEEAAPVHLPRPCVLAASTRDGEEKILWQAWQAAAPEDVLLVIVPRHPQRLAAIRKDLSLPAGQLAVRSRGEDITPATRIYLADTFGELGSFMAAAELVFMGGSLVAKGGQNVLEAAALGKAIVFGPHMDNFADEARLLLERKAALQVADTAGLVRVFADLLPDAACRLAMGKAARALVAEHRDMAGRYMDAIRPWCSR